MSDPFAGVSVDRPRTLAAWRDRREAVLAALGRLPPSPRKSDALVVLRSLSASRVPRAREWADVASAIRTLTAWNEGYEAGLNRVFEPTPPGVFPMFIFGIQPPPTYPAEAPRWGARAIYTESSFDLLYDRQQVTGGDPETRRQLVAWLNTKALPELRARAQRYELPVGSVDELVEIQSEGFCLQANPRKSYGYLYLGAWRTDAS